MKNEISTQWVKKIETERAKVAQRAKELMSFEQQEKITDQVIERDKEDMRRQETQIENIKLKIG